jgi:DNA adenine methylase
MTDHNIGEQLPLLRWAGSKKRQYERLRRFFPAAFKAYVEPFAGSAAFFFRLRPKVARLNDINQNVVHFYRDCRISPREFYEEFEAIPRNKRSYYQLRDKFNATNRSPEKSVLFYYLNRNCFNGIHRTNKKGEFNVPFSDNRVSPYLGKASFCESAKLLNNARISNLDFERFCKESVEKGDFVYLDPPYFKPGQRIFNEYNAFPFLDPDFLRLERTLTFLDRKGAKFLLTFAKTDRIGALSERWRSKQQRVTRSIAGNPTKRVKQTEVLIYNYDAI